MVKDQRKTGVHLSIQTVKQDREQEIQWIRAAQRDPEAFRALYLCHHAEIFRYLYKRVGDREATADLTADVFASALAYLPRYQITEAGFVAWLYQIAIRAMFKYFRESKKQRWVVLDDGLAERLSAEWVDLPGEWDGQKKQLERAIQRLSAEEITLIELRFYEERPFIQVAEILDLTESHARVKTYRALDKLRKYLR